VSLITAVHFVEVIVIDVIIEFMLISLWFSVWSLLFYRPNCLHISLRYAYCNDLLRSY